MSLKQKSSPKCQFSENIPPLINRFSRLAAKGQQSYDKLIFGHCSLWPWITRLFDSWRENVIEAKM